MPQQVTALANKHVSDVSCGRDFTVCTTVAGAVYVSCPSPFAHVKLRHTYTKFVSARYSFGANDEGALGCGDESVEESLVPQRVVFPSPKAGLGSGVHVSRVTCGDLHVVALTTTGTCYAWGNNDFGQLGVGDEDPRWSPELVSLRSRDHRQPPFIQMVSAGVDGTLFLTDQGRVFGTGNNSDNQLGLNHAGGLCGPMRDHSAEVQTSRSDVEDGAAPGSINAAVRPTPAYSLRPFMTTYVSISCGETHSAAVDVSGRLFLFGRNDKGQLGNGKFVRCAGAHKVIFDVPKAHVVVVGIGKDYTTAALEGGAIFSWGKADFGLLGVELADSCRKTCLPRQLEHDFHSVHQMCCTELSTIVISEHVTRTGILQQYDVQPTSPTTPSLATDSAAANSLPLVTSDVHRGADDLVSDSNIDDDLDTMPWLEKELNEGEYIPVPESILATHIDCDDTDSEDENELAESPWLLQELQSAEYIPMNSQLRVSSDTNAVSAPSTTNADASDEELKQSPWLAKELAENDVIPIQQDSDTDPESNDDDELSRMPWLRDELRTAEYIPSNSKVREGRVSFQSLAAPAVVAHPLPQEEDEGVRSPSPGTPASVSDGAGATTDDLEPWQPSREVDAEAASAALNTIAQAKPLDVTVDRAPKPAAVPINSAAGVVKPSQAEESVETQPPWEPEATVPSNTTAVQRAAIEGTVRAGTESPPTVSSAVSSVALEDVITTGVKSGESPAAPPALPIDASILMAEISALSQTCKKQALALDNHNRLLTKLHEIARDQETLIAGLQVRLTQLEHERREVASQVSPKVATAASKAPPLVVQDGPENVLTAVTGPIIEAHGDCEDQDDPEESPERESVVVTRQPIVTDKPCPLQLYKQHRDRLYNSRKKESSLSRQSGVSTERLIILPRSTSSNFGLKISATQNGAAPYPSTTNVASGARTAGLSQGDLVLQINGVATRGRSLKSLYNQLVNCRQNIELVVTDQTQQSPDEF